MKILFNGLILLSLIISQLTLAYEVEFFCQDKEYGKRFFIKSNEYDCKLSGILLMSNNCFFLNKKVNGYWKDSSFFISENEYVNEIKDECNDDEYIQPYGGFWYPGNYNFAYEKENGTIVHLPSEKKIRIKCWDIPCNVRTYNYE